MPSDACKPRLFSGLRGLKVAEARAGRQAAKRPPRRTPHSRRQDIRPPRSVRTPGFFMAWRVLWAMTSQWHRHGGRHETPDACDHRPRHRARSLRRSGRPRPDRGRSRRGRLRRRGLRPREGGREWRHRGARRHGRRRAGRPPGDQRSGVPGRPRADGTRSAGGDRAGRRLPGAHGPGFRADLPGTSRSLCRAPGQHSPGRGLRQHSDHRPSLEQRGLPRGHAGGLRLPRRRRRLPHRRGGRRDHVGPLSARRDRGRRRQGVRARAGGARDRGLPGRRSLVASRSHRLQCGRLRSLGRGPRPARRAVARRRRPGGRRPSVHRAALLP